MHVPFHTENIRIDTSAVFSLYSHPRGLIPKNPRIWLSGPTSGSKNHIQMSDEATTGTTTGAKYVDLMNLRSGMLESSIRAMIRASPVSKISFSTAKQTVLKNALNILWSWKRYL